MNALAVFPADIRHALWRTTGGTVVPPLRPQVIVGRRSRPARWAQAIVALGVLAALGVSGSHWRSAPEQDAAHMAHGTNSAADFVADPARVKIVLPQVDRSDVLALSHDEARMRNDAVPISAAPNPAAAPFRFRGDTEAMERAVDCLASAQYYEAGGDLEGQRAVAQVVLNRVRHPAYPASVCGVVYQGSERATGCQFTFTCDGALSRPPMPWLWDTSRQIARAALNGETFAKVGLATHYHTDWVVPYWSASLTKVAQVQTHLFFRFPGAWGGSSSFRQAYAGVEAAVPKLAALSRWHRNMPGSDLAGHGATGGGVIDGGTGAPAKLDPAAALAGVNLRGSQLRLIHPGGDAFGFLVPTGYPGALGLLALDVCGKRAFCKVMGWTDASAVPSGFPISYEAQAKMAFLYIHDGTRHGEITAWNCDIFPRRNPAECLTSRITQWDAVERAGGAAL